MRISRNILCAVLVVLLLPANGFVLYKAWNRLFPPPPVRPWEDARYRALSAEYARLNRLHRGRATVVLAGDSIFEFFRAGEYLGSRTVNRGIGRDTSAGLLRRWDETVAPLRGADVFLLVGTNDLLSGDDGVASNVSRILAKRGDSRMHVLSVPPTRRGRDLNERIRSVNAALAETARDADADWIDLTPLLADDEGALRPDLTTDGLHLNGAGYAILADVLRSRLPALP